MNIDNVTNWDFNALAEIVIDLLKRIFMYPFKLWHSLPEEIHIGAYILIMLLGAACWIYIAYSKRDLMNYRHL
jgi:hypothetical protein